MTAIRLTNVTIHARLRGKPGRGPVLVFSNSLGTDMRIWDAVIDRLPAGLTVLTYDKRGHGLSEATPGPYSVATHAGDLIGLLDHFGIGRAVICGLSVGGMIAQHVAAHAADRVAGLILCDTAPKIGTTEMWDARIAAVRENGLGSITDPVMQRWFTEAYRTTSPDFPLYRSMFAQQSVEGYCGTCAAIRDADLTRAVAGLALPVAVVVGAQDLSTPPDLVRAMASSISGASFSLVESCSHLPPIEQPDALAGIINDFVERLSAAGPDLHDRGMATRRLVLGDAHVDRAEAARTGFDDAFQTLITEAAWGRVWSRGHWTLRERSMVTIALLAALGHDEEVAMHVRATARTGASPDDIREALLHVAIYAGVPAANRAIRIARQTLGGMADEAADTGRN